MTFGIVVGWSAREEIPARLVTNHVQAIEMGYPYLLERSDEEIETLKATLERHAIRLWSVHAPFGNENNLSAVEEEKRLQAVETHKRLFPRAALAGAEVVIIHPGVNIGQDQREPAAEALRRSLPVVTQAAEEAGIRLGLENMLPNHLGDDEEQLLRFVEEIDSPALGICFDTGHAHCNRRFRQVFETLRPRIITFHLQDNDTTRDMHLQPGYGTIPWEVFLDVFGPMEFHDPLVIEAQPWEGADYRTMLDEMDLLFAHADALKPKRLSERLGASKG